MKTLLRIFCLSLPVCIVAAVVSVVTFSTKSYAWYTFTERTTVAVISIEGGFAAYGVIDDAVFGETTETDGSDRSINENVEMEDTEVIGGDNTNGTEGIDGDDIDNTEGTDGDIGDSVGTDGDGIDNIEGTDGDIGDPVGTDGDDADDTEGASGEDIEDPEGINGDDTDDIGSASDEDDDTGTDDVSGFEGSNEPVDQTATIDTSV